MKRQGDTILDQPAPKKSDNVSTDLRSKIGAKLSTFLSKISSAKAAESKRKLYEDLFRDSTHSQIIIDPTIVVKIEEESDSDDCTENASKFPAENFLTSAKSRLTELLHKRQDSGKENSPSSSNNAVTSSGKSNTLQSISCNSLNNRTKGSITDSSDSSSSDIVISQKQLKNVCVLVEDIVKSGSINSIHSLLNQQTKNNICSSVQNFSSESRKNILNSQKKHRNAKDNHINDKDVTSNRKSHQSIDELPDRINKPSSSHSNSALSNLEKQASKNSSQSNVPKSTIASKNSDPALRDDELSSNFLDLGDILIEGNEAKLQSYTEDSEYVDDPSFDGTVASEERELESICITPDLMPDLIQNDESPDADVVLLCEKRPTYEVITLEDDVEEVHMCPKCGKTFRAESLLNFHLRMHGSSYGSPSVSLQETLE